MEGRGRKSAASLSIVAGVFDGRPRAPDDLTDAQRGIWDRTVANEPAPFFSTAALQQLLKEYCRHCTSAAAITVMIEACEAAGVPDVKDYDKLLGMRDRETKAIVDKATKLRLTNQARYTPQAAATAAKKAQDVKPWQVGKSA